MGKLFMACGHEAIGDEWMEGYYWKEGDGGLAYGNLCSKCIPIYRAVQAKDWEEAGELLKNDIGVTLQDILAHEEGAIRTEREIGGITWDIVELPPKSSDT